jgi:uncharacterized protein (TIGR00297 family)
MAEEMLGKRWGKAIPEGRDRVQSHVLVGVIVPLLLTGAVFSPLRAVALGISSRSLVLPLLFSCGFAALVWMLRSATLPAAGIGLLICMILSQPPIVSTRASLLSVNHPATPALIVLIVLTFAATRYGRVKKEQRGLAEARSGRRASQIVANLGVAALCATVGRYDGCIAALAEAAADTVSSEIGQAIGGSALLITTFRRVPAGRDGGMSVAGTVAGVVAAGLVVMAGPPHRALWPDKVLVFAAACAGLVFDSFLGATVEERGWLGNDLVNFGSTLFAAAIPTLWGLARCRMTF